jgi:hypothetical protein
MKVVSSALLSFALAAAPLSAANAQEFHHYHHHHYGLVGGVFGLAGAVVVGAVTIVTAPIRILADAASGPRYHERADYDEPYGYDQRYGGYEGGMPAYGRDRPDYSGGPYPGAAEYGHAPRPYYGAPPQNYAPDYAPPNEYARSEDYAPRGYDRDYDRGRPAYGPPRYYERGDDNNAEPRERAYDPDFSRDQPYDDDGE